MKRIVWNYLVIAVFAVSFAFTSCNKDEDDKKFTVIFNSNGGSEIAAQIVTEGDKVEVPENPIREGYRFDGWYKDNNTFANVWNFESEIVIADVSLYAKWIMNKLGTLQKILDGYVVQAIAFDSKGNAWIGTHQGLIRYNDKETVVMLPGDFMIWDIAVDKKDNVWIGVSTGVWKYDGKEFTLYNSKNTAMPEDIVWNIAVDSKNNIWLASCRFRLGGLVKYDGTTWTTYTPGNSALPTNSVKSIAIDQSDNVWLALSDYVNDGYLVKISNDKWNVYAEKELGFKPYYFGGIQCDSKNRLWGAIDYSLSSTWVSPLPHFFIFDGEKTTSLSCGDGIRVGSRRSGITIDHDDYAWCFGMGSICGMWIGDQWTQFDYSEFGGSSAWVIKEDADHRIWIGTENGIYIK